MESALTRFLLGLVTVATLTTIFGRSNAPKVFDSIGTAGSNLISASLGRGAGVK